jgi:hypothetical protein
MKFADDRGVIAFDITALSRADQAPASIDVSHLRPLDHPTLGVARPGVGIRTSVSGDSRFQRPNIKIRVRVCAHHRSPFTTAAGWRPPIGQVPRR